MCGAPLPRRSLGEPRGAKQFFGPLYELICEKPSISSKVSSDKPSPRFLEKSGNFAE
jgi:hypothetical protein